MCYYTTWTQQLWLRPQGLQECPMCNFTTWSQQLCLRPQGLQEYHSNQLYTPQPTL